VADKSVRFISVAAQLAYLLGSVSYMGTGTCENKTRDVGVR
jgi:hypothetical protein